jgi:hypothetical protein
MINHRISSTIPSFPFNDRYDGKDNDDDDDDNDDDDVDNYVFYSKPFFSH